MSALTFVSELKKNDSFCWAVFFFFRSFFLFLKHLLMEMTWQLQVSFLMSLLCLKVLYFSSLIYEEAARPFSSDHVILFLRYRYLIVSNAFSFQSFNQCLFFNLMSVKTLYLYQNNYWSVCLFFSVAILDIYAHDWPTTYFAEYNKIYFFLFFSTFDWLSTLSTG